MNIEKYAYIKVSGHVYRFLSTGVQGEFDILVTFHKLRCDLFNLGFGVLDLKLGLVDDIRQIRNGDMDVILATVVEIAFDFLGSHDGVSLIACGSSPARTRNYQMGIAKYRHEIQGKHLIMGLICARNENGNIVGKYPNWLGSWMQFREGVNYDAFLISRI